MPTQSETTAAALLARSVVYGACSQAFSYPTEEQAEQLVHEDLPLASALAPALGADIEGAVRAAAEGFGSRTPEELEAAHREVFSHVHAVDCPPFETDYTARDVWRQGRELADLAGFYRAFGLEQVRDRPDAIGVELEFLHVITYKRVWAAAHEEAEHVEICRSAEEAFLRDHLLRWGPGFATRVERVAGGGPYAAAARLLLLLLRSEAARLGVAVDEVPATAIEHEADADPVCEGPP